MGIGGWGFRHNPQSLNPHFSFQSPNKIFAKKNVCHYQKAEEKTQIIFNPGRVVKRLKKDEELCLFPLIQKKI